MNLKWSRLGTEVDWDEEQECFETLSRELAEFYCLQYEDEEDDKENKDDNEKKQMEGIFIDFPTIYFLGHKSSREWTIEHVFFPAFRQRFLPSRSAAEDGTLVRIASLDKLYKVFERCWLIHFNNHNYKSGNDIFVE